MEKYLQKLRKIVSSKNGKIICCNYKNYNSIVKIKCKHGHVWETKAYNIFYDKWCPVCYKEYGTSGINADQLLKKYKELQSYSKVAKYFNISTSSVCYKLKKVGKNSPPVFHMVNHNAFDKNNKYVFYWAGFLAADGCVRLSENKYKTLLLGLSKTDYKFLEMFKEFVGFSGPIYEYRDSCSVSIRSDKIFDKLNKFNILPNKSLTYSVPDDIANSHLFSHFLRGYFDGDGSVMHVGGKKLAISFCGTFQTIKVIHDAIKTNCKISYNKKITNRGNIFVIRYCGNVICKKIYNFMYHGSSDKTRLERKYNKFMEILDGRNDFN